MPPESASPAERAERVFQLSLLLLVATGCLALLATGRAGLLPAIAVAAALGVKLLLGVIGAARIRVPPRLVSLLALALLLMYGAEVYYPSPSPAEGVIPATMRLLLLLSALKLVAAEKGRDYFFLGLLGFLQLLAASLFLLDLTYLAALLLFLLLATTTYAAFEITRGCRAQIRIVEDANPKRRKQLGRQLLLLSSTVTAGILALSIVLFFALPRTEGRGPFPGLRDYSIGFSQEVNLGATGTVQPDYTPVMRVEPLSGDDLSGLRWRGLALWRFDGLRWTNPSNQMDVVDVGKGLPGSPQRRSWASAGRLIQYAVSLEPLPTARLFLSGLPQWIRVPASTPLLADDTGSFLVRGRFPKTLRYEVESWIPPPAEAAPARAMEVFAEEFAEKYLALPQIDARIPELARQIAGEHPEPLRKAEAIERYLRNEFGYTIDLPLQRQHDPLASFLFDRRAGHCEYFASAMVVMLRTLGIPARMAAGFAGGVFNPVSNLQIVRASDAHTWVEAYLPRHGWVSFDPTPLAPDDLAATWYGPYWMYWDALRSSWSEWVVDYDTTRQILLIGKLREASQQTAWGVLASAERAAEWMESLWRQASVTMTEPLPDGGKFPAALPLFAIALCVVAFVLWRWARPRLILAYRSRRLASGIGSADDCSFLYRRAIRVAEKRGFPRQEWQTPEEFAASIRPPALQELVGQITAVYNAARFGRDTEAERRLPELVQALEKSR
jgi:protein-glutamine gamma-glutamyltransferase